MTIPPRCIQIGENIKRLRRERNLTQEELAEIFGVSCAAVSKWERNETYPDITLLFPLAGFFGVSLDELMGYSTARMEEELNAIFEKHSRLFRANRMKEAIELMTQARRDFPTNYRIMNQYMWDIAGSYADNDPAVLLAHKEEFSALCRQIIDHCLDNRIRLDALNMQAKLLHAEGRTEEALAVYKDHFPDWYQTMGQKSEQLFAKDTPEFRTHLIYNMLELASFAANKKLKEIWYCSDISLEEKAIEGMELGTAISEMREKYGYERLCWVEYEIYSDHTWKLSWFGAETKEIAQSLDKLLESAALCDTLARRDETFRYYLTHDMESLPCLLKKKISIYRTTEIERHCRLRDIPEIEAILDRWDSLS